MTQAAPPPLAAPSPELLKALAATVGDAHVLRDGESQARYLIEWRDRYRGRTAAVIRPATTEEVARILTLCNEARVGLVPQGGNTGLVGGQIPSLDGRELVLSLERLTRVRSLDRDGGTMTVEAGMPLAAVQAAADAAGWLFPLALASEGSCRIGGNLATNAGGAAVLAYGTTRNLVLGLEVVLADGRVWNGLRALKKDNTGYDLRDLFIGSEGTLGVITAATLKLVPKPAERAVALVGVQSLDALLGLFRLAEARAGGALTGFEFMAARALDFVLKHAPGTRSPLQGAYSWTALIEISASEIGKGTAALEDLLTAATEQGLAAEVAIATSLSQAAELWRLREAMSEAQKGEGGSIKHDVSVPVAAIPEFLDRAGVLIERLCPGARPVPFGHFGDGNVHYNVSQPVEMEKARFLGLWEEMQDAVHGLVVEMGGSFSAEHGIGQMKRAALARYRSPVELDLMRAIKSALDPNGILNPGKVL